MLLECKELIKIYYDKNSNLQVPALRGVDLRVKESDLVALIGPSGFGKSTFINLIGGHDSPSSGEIIFRDQFINNLSEKELNAYRRNIVGFLYQMPERNLLWNLTVQQNVLLPMKFTDKLGRSQQKKYVKELLERLELNYRKNHKPYQLSGGEAQRVSLAVALANNPEILLADEPTGELDSVTTLKIIEYLKELNSDLGITIIVVTHDHRFARMTNKVLKIQDGRFSGFFTSKNVLSFSDSEKLTYIDKFGTLIIPEHYRKAAHIKNYVRFEIVDGKLVVLPANSDDREGIN